ncbi:UV radiation resistance protein and autophagy-related subunit 14-domain-containing protein [Cokeromyces recurvatus]|uniref:UV radiation resistance protein and autophagy-related subunit 14-domain-containing protein n=1 Tax=Cokeromyces recurvatus TaxID=90255 RepID=UPI0022204CD8|nr:UV radiation resistance protein and autophagy-related subunit 14-domain-containing protein [Cokeromyces recurvatus]KAI7899632.1 UV radiation resistance protein and autophagy-related subunit 14-domain-containing protein [Cokeromyces recurvatus]
MNCKYCHTSHRKFYCIDCIKEKLQKHEEEINITIIERDAAVDEANHFLKKTEYIQQLIAEKNKRAMKLESLQESQICMLNETKEKKIRIKELEKQITDKRRILEECIKRKSHYQKLCMDNHNKNSTLLRAWQRTHKMTVGTRRILVKEVSSLFELKPGVVEEPVSLPMPSSSLQAEELLPPFSQPTTMQIGNKEDLYICGVTLPTRLIDVTKYPKEELNAPIGLVIHMLGLVVRYLGIKMPFIIIQKGLRHYIRMVAPNRQLWHNYRKMPLFLEEDDKNFKKFVIGMAMLNYNLAYICYTQGVKIPVSQVANTLQSLMACCCAPNLGIQSHALYYHGIRDLKFPIEFKQVLRATNFRYRCSSLLDVNTTNELHTNYFKVKSSKRTYHQKRRQINEGEEEEEEEEEEYDGLYVDSDNDDTLLNNQQLTRLQAAPTTPHSETWSLIEVAPFL